MLISVSYLLKILAIRLCEAYVLAEMVNHSDGESLCAPVREIACWCNRGHSWTATVINRIEHRGLIRIDRRRTPTGFHAANSYRFSPEVPVRNLPPAPVRTSRKQERSLEIHTSLAESCSKEKLEPKNGRDLVRCAPFEPPPAPFLTAIRRHNLIKGLRSGVAYIPSLRTDWQARMAIDEMLTRAEAAIPDWKSRTREDKAAFEQLVKLSRLSRMLGPSVSRGTLH